ncbi:hypothetical protein [Streptomyces sp. NRRL F-5126]|uniref:hypothetical protein n=1 Tax=Streptomyces sp. NRRL F-5126 TaxID=1463857 RepID=UPI00131E4B1D|nr:hypothetical protein [Streptomyces sp. NRRL F-5126]
MPATLTASHLAPSLPTTELVSVSDLSNSERAVALYASDMPGEYRYHRGDDGKVFAWIVQGACRLGLPELYRSAAFQNGYRLLWLARTATGEQEGAHKRRFPNAARLRRALSLASLTVGMTEMSPAARERGGRPQVEGACRCAGTGWFEVCYDPEDPTSVALENCAGHNPKGHMPTPAGVSA